MGAAFRSTICCSGFIPRQAACNKLSQETPALFIAFDLLATAKDKQLSEQPLRRTAPGLGSVRQGPVQVEPDISVVAGDDKLRDSPRNGWRSPAAAATA